MAIAISSIAEPNYIAPSHKLLWRAWDDVFVVYNALSGRTHILDEFCYHLLEMVSEGRAKGADIIAGLTDRFDIAAEGDLADIVSLRLQELGSLGLIQKAPLKDDM